MAIDVQSYTAGIDAAKRQFDWLEISYVYDKSNQHNFMYDSYYNELAAVVLRKVKVKYITNAYSILNELKFDLTDKDLKFVFHKQFVQYNNTDCRVAPVTDYAHNEIFQELQSKPNFFLYSTEEYTLM